MGKGDCLFHVRQAGCKGGVLLHRHDSGLPCLRQSHGAEPGITTCSGRHVVGVRLGLPDRVPTEPRRGRDAGRPSTETEGACMSDRHKGNEEDEEPENITKPGSGTHRSDDD
ncbi:hypothetical protein GCM10009864_64960 [Streptomyces lunalinharesii]|uniref:Uncharacterized protein n=1 Tax=Streptomyces lunalinharesii TaxID=333384 RepID=A0ABN3SQT9_9ACTN